ncbi:MAG: dodecin family protein, partial [Rhodomicrobium sp.]
APFHAAPQSRDDDGAMRRCVARDVHGLTQTAALPLASFSIPPQTIYICKNMVREDTMTESVYKIIELVGTSTESWEKAAAAAIERASKSLRDLRIAEIVELDMQLDNGKVEAYRAKVKVSFKYEDNS